jgi:hypothetical protein
MLGYTSALNGLYKFPMAGGTGVPACVNLYFNQAPIRKQEVA